MKRLRAGLFAAILSAGVLTAAIVGTGTTAATPVVSGWNNVPYLGQSGPPTEALATISGQYDAVYRWNTTTKTCPPDGQWFSNSDLGAGFGVNSFPISCRPGQFWTRTPR